MSEAKVKLPEIPEADQTPLVQALLETILKQQERIDELEAEVKRLKELNGKPKLKPSRMDAETDKQGGGEEEERKKRKPGPKRAKTGQLKVHEEQKIAPEGLSADARKKGWRFKGYDDFVVQELRIEAHTVRYRLETWIGPDDQTLKGRLPISVQGRYGAQLKSYVLYQYHHQGVTQPLLLEHLHDLGIEISAGQLSRPLT